MGDKRHKRKYPEGKRHEMTPRWKQRVRDRLRENKGNNVYPRDQAELADAIGASDKSSITKMLQAESSKLVPKVCSVLQIPMPLVERHDDELQRVVALLENEQRERALKAIRLLFPSL